MSTDDIYQKPRTHIVDFSFDEQVAHVFPDMIRRSVPGYETLIGMLGLFIERYAQNHSAIYDLGCSLGASTLALAKRLGESNAIIHAVDNSQAMIEQCKKNTQSFPTVHYHCADIMEIEFERASVVVMNFTLQFIPLQQRAELIQRIYDGLLPGGVFVLSEKIQFDDDELNNELIQLHHQFKSANGYSKLEISQKRQALENVLIPETIADHEQRLQACGFQTIRLWHQSINFVSMYAVKS